MVLTLIVLYEAYDLFVPAVMAIKAIHILTAIPLNALVGLSCEASVIGIFVLLGVV